MVAVSQPPVLIKLVASGAVFREGSTRKNFGLSFINCEKKQRAFRVTREANHSFEKI